MTQTTRIILYGTGVLLMALSGLLTTSRRSIYVAFMMSGLLLIAAAGRRDFAKPKTALLLLIVSNLSFWLCVALWFLRGKLIGPLPFGGIDPFVGPLLLWFAVLLVLLIYEIVVFVMGMIANRDRKLSAIGLAAVVAQFFLTLGFIYLWIQGV